MLLLRAPKDISQPGQAYKMGILGKIVNVLKSILKLIWWILTVYFFWILESVIRVIQLVSAPKKLFVSYLSITWVTTHWIQGNNRILTITRIAWITRFPFISCLDQFCLYFPKSSVKGILRKHKWKNPKSIYVIKRTSGLCEWLLQSVTQWLDQLDHQSTFVCVSISRITWINGSGIHFSKQITPYKCQAYRMKVLSFTLSLSYR